MLNEYKNMKKIAILIPTRDRNIKIRAIWDIWFSLLDPDVSTDCIVILDEDNEKKYDRLPGFLYKIAPNSSRRGMNDPLNYVAREIYKDYEYLGFMGDDHMPRTLHWNSILYKILRDNGRFAMAYGNDLLQGSSLCTHVIMDSRYVRHLGYMAYPELQHLYIDNFWMFVGHYLKNIHYLDHVIIEHMHYICQKSEMDDMYREVNSESIIAIDFNTHQRMLHDPALIEILDRLCKIQKARRVIITGGAGFVGRHFCARYSRMGWDTICVDNLISDSAIHPSSPSYPSHLRCDDDYYTFLQQDCIDFFHENPGLNVDLVIHLAAVVGGRATIEHRPLDVAIDLVLDAKMFHWAITAKPTKIIYFSSSAAYPIHLQQDDEQTCRLSEDMIAFENILGMPDMSYGWSKLTGEYLARLAHEQYGLDIIVYRPFSGYGEDQHISYPFPNLLRQVRERATVIDLWSDTVRDFIYIEDIIDHVLHTMDFISDGTALNIGSGKPIRFSELVQTMCTVLHHDANIRILKDKCKGVPYRVSDPSKSNDMGFFPKTTLENGIKICTNY